MSSIPPKHMPDAASAAEDAPETGGGLVAMYNAASHANAESFPVLKAFQDYIEAERAQARRRVVQLSVFFAVLMVVVVGGFLTAGIAMWRSNDARVDKLLEAVVAQKTAPAPAPALQASPVIEESVRQMSRATSELQSSLDKKLDGVSEIASKVNERVASQNSEMEKLRNELKQMQEQSAKLKDELVSVKQEVAKKPEPPKPAAPKPGEFAIARPPLTTPNPIADAPVIANAPTVAVAPTALAAAAKPKPAPAAAPAAQPAPTVAAAPKAETRDPRFPPAVKDPPVAPADVKPPAAPAGMLATAIPLQTKNVGTIPWRVLIPE